MSGKNAADGIVTITGATPKITAFKRGDISFFELLHGWDYSGSTVRIKIWWGAATDDWRQIHNQGSVPRDRFTPTVWDVLRRFGAGHYRIEVINQARTCLMRQEFDATPQDFEDWGQIPQNPPEEIPGGEQIAGHAAPAASTSPPPLNGLPLQQAIQAMAGSYSQQAKMMDSLNGAVEKMARFQAAQSDLLLKLAERTAREPPPPQSELAATLAALIASLPALVNAFGSNAKNANGNETAQMMRDYYERMGEFQARRHAEISEAAERRHNELLAQQREINDLQLKLATVNPELKFIESEGVKSLLDGAGQWLKSRALPPPAKPAAPALDAKNANPGVSPPGSRPSAAPPPDQADFESRLAAFAADIVRLARDDADQVWSGGYHYLLRRYRDQPDLLMFCASEAWETLHANLAAMAPDIPADRWAKYVMPIHAQMVADMAAAQQHEQHEQLPEGGHDGTVDRGGARSGSDPARGHAAIHN